MERFVTFLQDIHSIKLSVVDRAVAVLWCNSIGERQDNLSAQKICALIEAAGFGQQNPSRLVKKLENDRRVIKGRDGCYAIHASSRKALDEQFASFIQGRPVVATNSVLDKSLFAGSRGYIEKVVDQINGSFDVALYDCCAVMCRRLLETLIIEVYESKSREAEIKGSDGHFYMFSGLLAHVEREQNFTLGRSALHALKAFKKIGDLSAHNRRFNARKNDINDVKGDLRIAAEELLHLSGLV